MEQSLIYELIFDGFESYYHINLFKNLEYANNTRIIEKMLEKLCDRMTEEEKLKIMLEYDGARNELETVIS